MKWQRGNELVQIKYEGPNLRGLGLLLLTLAGVLASLALGADPDETTWGAVVLVVLGVVGPPFR